ncbi:MAG: hypothetical protein R8G66_29215 [Cytophagales bacterium]|nr:hypothetical protein [Cytophagales bacterium]
MANNRKHSIKTGVVQSGTGSAEGLSSNQALTHLRAAIAKGDADYHSERTYEYTTPTEMISELLKGK